MNIYFLYVALLGGCLQTVGHCSVVDVSPRRGGFHVHLGTSGDDIRETETRRAVSSGVPPDEQQGAFLRPRASERTVGARSSERASFGAARGSSERGSLGGAARGSSLSAATSSCLHCLNGVHYCFCLFPLRRTREVHAAAIDKKSPQETSHPGQQRVEAPTTTTEKNSAGPRATPRYSRQQRVVVSAPPTPEKSPAGRVSALQAQAPLLQAPKDPPPTEDNIETAIETLSRLSAKISQKLSSEDHLDTQHSTTTTAVLSPTHDHDSDEYQDPTMSMSTPAAPAPADVLFPADHARFDSHARVFDNLASMQASLRLARSWTSARRLEQSTLQQACSLQQASLECMQASLQQLDQHRVRIVLEHLESAIHRADELLRLLQKESKNEKNGQVLGDLVAEIERFRTASLINLVQGVELSDITPRISPREGGDEEEGWREEEEKWSLLQEEDIDRTPPPAWARV